MADDLTLPQKVLHKEVEQATIKAITNPTALADLIVKGLNDQTTPTVQSYPSVGQGHAETEVPDTSRGIEETAGMVTVEEVKASLEKPESKKVVSRTLPTKGKLVESTGDDLYSAEDSASDHVDAAILESEASDVASISVEIIEIKGVVNSLEGKIMSTFQDFESRLMNNMSRMESRISTLESRLAQNQAPPQSHRRVLSGNLQPLTLPSIAGITANPDPPKSLIDLGELLERCKIHKFTPSKLAQKQIFTQLADGKDLGDLELPLTRSQWKPENLVKIVMSFK